MIILYIMLPDKDKGLDQGAAPARIVVEYKWFCFSRVAVQYNITRKGGHHGR
jgi:hypothetical protein